MRNAKRGLAMGLLLGAVLAMAGVRAEAQAVQVPAKDGKPAHTVYIFWGCGTSTGLTRGGRAETAQETPPTEPLVDGRYYKQCTAKEDLTFYKREVLSTSAFLFPAISSAINYARNTPTGWGQDFPGYMQRFGSAYGQQAIRATTRYGMASLLHEDVYYRICHKCKAGAKIENAILSEFTARHGADGHRTFSLTPIVSEYSGALVAYGTWYPPGYDVRDAAIHGTTGIPIRIGIKVLREFVFDRESRREKEAQKASQADAAAAGVPAKP